MASRSAQSSILASAKKRKREDGTAAEAPKAKDGPAFKSKVLILSSRGITYHMRHLMSDLADLMPHGKRDTKLDTKHALPLINELAYLSSCSHAMFFECRRHSDLYLWLSRCPNGPSIRFHVVNMHTLGELGGVGGKGMTGNCLKGSRPVVVFGKEFEELGPSWKVCKEVLASTFAVPKTARRAKPFVDHVVSFSILDNKIWFRNYQIVDPSDQDPNAKPAKRLGDLSLAEIGPRFVLVPIKIFEGSFGGPSLWENKEFVPPRKVLKEQKLAAAGKHLARKGQDRERTERQVLLEHERKRAVARKGPRGMEKRSVFA